MLYARSIMIANQLQPTVSINKNAFFVLISQAGNLAIQSNLVIIILFNSPSSTAPRCSMDVDEGCEVLLGVVKLLWGK